MTILIFATSLLIVSGAALLFFAILRGSKIGGSVPPELIRRWRIMITLMVFSLGGYVLIVFLLVKGLVFPTELVMGLVFMGAAFLGLIMINLARETITKIRSAEEDLMSANRSLERRTNELAGTNEQLQKSLTDLTRAEDQLKRYSGDLERKNRELEQFAYMASHDLRSPVIAIAADLKMFIKRNRAKMDQESINLIEGSLSSAFRMQNLIADLLTYARLGATPQERLRGSINLTEILNVAVDSIKIDCTKAGCSIVRDELPRVAADPAQMIQLFQNLLSNAIKFRGKEPPRIEVRAMRRNMEWLFSVKDNGIGIPLEHQEKIFELFHRVSKGEYEGTGIGLSICKRIVERHGGRIWVESEPGKGSTFYFTIPASLAAES
ncbi:MAG: ATP-binding protein [Nitrospiraceae bacterium]|nr:ATP-binding protein [Nitrospiraceae bacterium]